MNRDADIKNKSFQLYNESGLKNNLYEQLLNAMPDMVLVTGKSDHVLYMNKSFSNLIGQHVSDGNISMKEIINMDDWNNWNENLFRLSSLDNKSDCVFNIRFNTPNTGVKYVQLHGKVLRRDEEFKPIAYFFKGEDVTEQYKKESTLIQNDNSSKTWKTFVSKSSAEQKLELAVKDLDRSNKDLEEFAYVASHDLQEPLRKIAAFSSRLEYKYGDALGEEGNLYLNKINAATGAMKDLIENLLQVSRTIAHLQPFEPTNLNNVLKEVIQNLDLKIEERNVKITCEDLPVIEAYPSQMKQLFNNLLSNAIKFSLKDVQPVIKIRAEEILNDEKRTLHLSTLKTYFKITVKDNGIGFNSEDAENIFKIFYRLNGKSEYPGTGIGLAICNKIAQKHNGIIKADSETGKGASFIIILPKNQEKS